MGNETEESIIDTMQEILGLNESAEISAELITDENKEIPAEVVKPTAILVTQEQLSINKDIAKIDSQIEALESQTVDASAFYDNLETELSESEQELEFSDKPAYMKLVATKANAYVTKHSKATEITSLQEEKKELELVYERQSAIMEVSSKYPDYNHEKMLSYYTNDLSKSEQDKIIQGSKSYQDVYENTYKKFLSANPTNITTQKAPNIPNVNNARKQSVNSANIDHGLTSHDEQLKKALGL
ncbi:MAG: hypothetical protein NTW78_03860 [Campylobacterales bacterium]|nr:hypothetical protein [Campylobacterales bacterium]